MKIYQQLHLQADYKDVLENGQKVANRYLKIFYKVRENQDTRFGIMINRKFGNAVHRNKAKRQLRSLIIHHLSLVPTGFDIIFFLKNHFTSISYEAKIKMLLELYKKGRMI
jgi:ribonuclease P protein component